MLLRKSNFLKLWWGILLRTTKLSESKYKEQVLQDENVLEFMLNASRRQGWETTLHTIELCIPLPCQSGINHVIQD